VIGRQNESSWDVWHIGSVEGKDWNSYAELSEDDLPYGSRSLGLDLEDLCDLERLPVHPEIGIHASVQRISRFVDRSLIPNALHLSLSKSEHLEFFLGEGQALPQDLELEILLNKETAAWLLAHRGGLAGYLPNLRIHQPHYEFLKDAVANDVRDPKKFFLQLDLPIRVSGLPACLTPNVILAEAPRILHQSMFDPETGRLDIRELARTHVIDGYWGKSLRCRECRLNDRCDGAHINFLRDQGFAQLEPLREGPWSDSAEEQMNRLRPQPPARLRDGKPKEPVAPSLPGYAPPQAAPVEPLMEIAQRAREARERRRREFQKETRPPA